MVHNMKRNATNLTRHAKVRRACETTILPGPKKSYSDCKSYRLLQLPNGLTALLIQHFIMEEPVSSYEQNHNIYGSDVPFSSLTNGDTEDSEEESGDSDGSEDSERDDEHDNGREKMAAVALCIDVGSFEDPPEIQGLSHFLEHMIFMGSEKFPKENEFDQFISAHGGSDNAMTECQHTLFYFDVVEESLEGGVDRFSQLFVAPIMLRDAMDREMEAVESEFQNTINDDDARIAQIIASLANGPASTFTWGNLKTLKDSISNEELYKAVHDFRKKHYLANRMYLCIESSRELDELQKIVEDNFSKIPTGPLVGVDRSINFQNAFKPEFFEKIYYVKPKADKTKLFMTFVLPPLAKHYRSKPHDYLAYIIQHEGVGSITSYLKKNLLAIRIIAGADNQSFEDNTMFTLFSIEVTLTEKGYNNVDKVIEAIFAFLLLLKETSLPQHEKAFMELKKIKETAFKYREEKPSTSNVEELSVNMKYYNHRDIISGSDLYYEFDGPLVMEMIERLNEMKFNLILLTDKRKKFEKIESWFGTEYDEEDFPAEFVKLWNTRKLWPEFSMPPPNEFICSNFDIIAENEESNIISRYPNKITTANDSCECFYKLDATFKLPHGYVCVYLSSPKTMETVRNMNLTSLYSMLVKHYLTEKLYPAVCAGLGYQIYSEEKGIVVKLSGYNEKLPILLDIITKELKCVGDIMEETVFETYRKQFKKYVYNNLISSKFYNKDCRLNIIEENHKFNYDRYIESDFINFEDLKEFAGEFLNELRVQILVQGNFTKSNALDIKESLLKNLNCKLLCKPFESRAHRLPVGTNVLYIKSMLPNDKNSTTTNYYQFKESSIRLQCLIEFVLKIMEEPLFDILRTQEQLGYAVGGTYRFNNGILGLSITIQSQENKHTTVAVEQRIEKFLHENVAEILTKLSDDEFETIQTALIKLKHMVDVELECEINKFWPEITSNEYIFNRLELEADMLAKITKHEVIAFYNETFDPKNVKKLSVQVIGSIADEGTHTEDEHCPVFEIMCNHYKNDEQEVIKDMNEFRNSLPLYPVTKTAIDD